MCFFCCFLWVFVFVFVIGLVVFNVVYVELIFVFFLEEVVVFVIVWFVNVEILCGLVEVVL